MKAWLRRVPGYGLARTLYRIARGGEQRSVELLRLRRPEDLFQPFPDTTEDRYPDLFRLARERIGDGPDRRLLSFGCSTGEEVFALRRHFPQAAIRGLDINPHCIAVCGEKLAAARDPRLSCAVAGSAAAEEAESCDAVFAMAVFRHGDLGSRPPRCDHLLRFAAFERAVADLARVLRPGGLLLIRHANFRFADTAAAASFDSVLTRPEAPVGSPWHTPVYGPDDRLLPPGDVVAVAFVKRP